MNKTAEVHGALGELVQDNLKFISNFQVSNKLREVVSFRPQLIQRDILRQIDPPGSRNVFVKPAQVGASTCIIAYFLGDTITTPGTTSVIVAYEEFITERLLNKAQFFYDQLPSGLKTPMTASSKHEKSFKAINSTFYIGTARSYTFGRGDAIHNFLADEYAFWVNVGNIMVPVLERIPAFGRCAVLSTPNGRDNPFYQLYKEGLTGNSVWRSHFYPWPLHWEYQYPEDSPIALPRDRVTPLLYLNDREEVLLEAGLTYEQLRWRRAKKAELGALTADHELGLSFEQEFPEDDVSCFLTAGNMVYDVEILADMAQMAKAPIDYWHADWPGSADRDLKLWQWERPEDGVQYLISCDPGMGITTETAIEVWRFWMEQEEDDFGVSVTSEHGKLVARHYSKFEPEETAIVLKAVGKYYNYGVLAVEANNHGIAVMSDIRDYPNIYYREDIVNNKVTKKHGWLTTTTTKPYMIKELRDMLPRLEINDHRLIGQFSNIRKVKNPNTQKWDFESIGADDIHDAAAIAVTCRQAMSVVRGFAGTSGFNW